MRNQGNHFSSGTIARPRLNLNKMYVVNGFEKKDIKILREKNSRTYLVFKSASFSALDIPLAPRKLSILLVFKSSLSSD